MSGELLFLMIVGLILFGPEELPKIARSVGRLIYEFKKAASDVQHEMRNSVDFGTEESVSPAPSSPEEQKEDDGEKRN